MVATAVAPRINAVIRAEPDGYGIGSPWMMGRHVAGQGFLRAFVSERGPGDLFAYAPLEESAKAVARLIHSLDPQAACRWIRGGDLGRIGASGGVLYLGDATLPSFARARLRAGVGAYSLCGVTHTISTPGTMQAIADLLSAPVAPWDALVCTSQAAVEAIRRLHEAEAEALRWRFGRDIPSRTPQLPVIPLGVHSADFAFSEAERAVARQSLGVAPDETVVLFVGRLTLTGKLNPFAMYNGLQAAATRTGRPLVLLQCGHAPNEAIGSAFVSGPEQFAPDIRSMVVDSRDDATRRQAWAAGDLFISLSDNIQETFGLTPVEAMAAGLPCVVSDWDGYRDTVRDGVDGFRIPTWAPRPGAIGREIAREQEVGALSYDGYLWAAAGATSVDHAALADALSRLIEDPNLRRTLGEAGRKRARETFDWSRIVRRYHALWAELNARRAAALADPAEAAWIAAAPQAATSASDPFWAFGHYASAHIELSTSVALTAAAPPGALEARRGHLLFSGLRLPEAAATSILARLAQGPATVAEAAQAAGAGSEATIYFVGILAKMGLVRLG